MCVVNEYMRASGAAALSSRCCVYTCIVREVSACAETMHLLAAVSCCRRSYAAGLPVCMCSWANGRMIVWLYDCMLCGTCAYAREAVLYLGKRQCTLSPRSLEHLPCACVYTCVGVLQVVNGQGNTRFEHRV